MKKCKKCHEEIQDEAKKCKHCGEDLRNWFVRHKVITVFLVVLLIGFIGSAMDDNNPSPQNVKIEQYKQINGVVDLTKFTPPSIVGYSQPIITLNQADFIGFAYDATGGLVDKLLSASATVNIRESMGESIDYSSFNEYFPVENQEIEIGGAKGRMGYEDYSEYKGVLLTKKYETIQVEVINDKFRYAVQLGHPGNDGFVYKQLYKDEAIKIIKALMKVYK